MSADVPPKVSVAMITYNHEEFITQAVESVLMQQTNFAYELVIGEDYSTDSTRAILQELQERHPDKIRLLLPEKNIGMMPNTIQTLQVCRGQYVALLEGDDYWTSPHKLQKQADHMDAHPECAICFHNVTAFYQDGTQPPYEYCPSDQKQVSTLDDLLVRNFIPTCSTLFRRGLFDDFPDWYPTSKMGDWPLHVCNAQHGNIRYINEIMAAYRLHSGGTWFSCHRNYALYLESCIPVYRNFLTYLGANYASAVGARLASCHYELAMIFQREGELEKARAYARKCLSERQLSRHVRGRLKARMVLMLYSPGLYKLTKPFRPYLPPAAFLFYFGG